jgi:hypothetical protein
VTVLYHPATPDDARIDTGNWLWVILGGVGALVLLLGLRMFIMSLFNPFLYTTTSE